MSLFAGIYAVQKSEAAVPPPSDAVTAIARTISRAGDAVQTFQSDRFFLAKVDIGAFSGPAYHHVPGAFVAALAGRMLLDGMPGNARQCDLIEVVRRLTEEGDLGSLRSCQGSFALCHYDIREHQLLLATDKLGIRPVYYSVTQDHVYFANSLRVMESISGLQKRLDMQGLAEILAFKYPLANRTPYADIKILESAEAMLCQDGKVANSRYFRWDALDPSPLGEESLLDAAYELFRGSVLRQCDPNRRIVSLLSGGLDSRCIVMMLKQLGLGFTALTFEHGYIDDIIARSFSKAMGIPHVITPGFGQGEMEWASQIKNVEWEAETPPSAPLVFSGDGGSVGVGYVYVEEEDIRSLRQAGFEIMAEKLWRRGRPSERFFRRDVCAKLSDALREGIWEEFRKIECEDPGRAAHLFFMNNDQRRHLHPLFENMDEWRVEFLTPFFDGLFMELILTAPVDIFPRHRFYHRWVRRFPEAFMAVPWQTYRGHLPCPVQGHITGRTQWDRTRWALFSRSLPSLRRALALCFSPGFPSSIMRRGAVLLAAMMHASSLRNYGYVLAALSVVGDYNRMCSGVHDFPPVGGHLTEYRDTV